MRECFRKPLGHHLAPGGVLPQGGRIIRPRIYVWAYFPDFTDFWEFAKGPGQILNHVTALISEQFSKLWPDGLSFAKLGKHILQKARAVLVVYPSVHCREEGYIGFCTRPRQPRDFLRSKGHLEGRGKSQGWNGVGRGPKMKKGPINKILQIQLGLYIRKPGKKIWPMKSWF